MADSTFVPVPKNPRSFLERRHPLYEETYAKWRWAWLTYSGECMTEKYISEFLVQRQTGESTEAYRERQRIADYTPHFGTVVDALAGMLFANEDDATRVLAATSGDSNPLLDPLSPLAQLWKDADGRGNGWVTKHKTLAIDLIVHQTMWGIVFTDPATGDPRVDHLSPLLVLDWDDQDSPGHITSVLVLDPRPPRPRVGETMPSVPDDRSTERYLLYTTEGVRAFYRNTRTGEPIPDGDVVAYSFTDRWGRPTTPLFPVTIPIRRYVGWLLSVKQNAIFNMESGRDYLQWIGSFPKLKLAATDVVYEKLIVGMQAGSNVLQDDPTTQKTHEYINPPTENTRQQTETLKRKVEEFYVTAFREYSDAAIERSATEVRQDTAQGVGAFLQLLKGALDDAETQALGRIMQILAPSRKDDWWVARVERSSEVVPLDTQVWIEKVMNRAFGQGKAVPWGKTAMVDAAMEIARYDGRAVDQNEVAAAVDLDMVIRAIDAIREIGVDLPAEAKAKLATRVLTALDAMPKGGEQTLIDEYEEDEREVQSMRQAGADLMGDPDGLGSRTEGDDA